jgi:hypothetical protein
VSFWLRSSSLRRHLLARRNRQHLDCVGDDPRLAARIASFEMSYRMQAEAPQVMDFVGGTGDLV